MLESKSKSTIALFGEVLADVFPDSTVLGGAPYNVARHLHAFKQHPVLITRTGQDDLKDQFYTQLTTLGMDISGFQMDTQHPTGQVIVDISKTHPDFNICSDQAYDYIDADSALATIKSSAPDLVYFGTLAQRNDTSRHALDSLLKQCNCPKFFDINLRTPWYTLDIIETSLQHADILKINDEELNIVSQLLNQPFTSITDSARFLIDQYHIALVFVTCGAKGAWAITKDGFTSHVKGIQTKSVLVDTVGAGDAFSAMTMIGALQGWSIETILSRANEFAASFCTVRGASVSNQDFYLPFIKSWMQCD